MSEIDPKKFYFKTYKVVQKFDGMLISALCKPPGLLTYGKHIKTKAIPDFANKGLHPTAFDDFDSAADFFIERHKIPRLREFQIWLAYGRGRIEKLTSPESLFLVKGTPLMFEWPRGTVMYEEIELAIFIYETIPPLGMSELNPWERLSEARQPGISRYRRMVEELQGFREIWRESDEE